MFWIVCGEGISPLSPEEIGDGLMVAMAGLETRFLVLTVVASVAGRGGVTGGDCGMIWWVIDGWSEKSMAVGNCFAPSLSEPQAECLEPAGW